MDIICRYVAFQFSLLLYIIANTLDGSNVVFHFTLGLRLHALNLNSYSKIDFFEMINFDKQDQEFSSVK